MRKSRRTRSSRTEFPVLVGSLLKRLETVKIQSRPTTAMSTMNHVLKYRLKILDGTMIVMPSSTNPVVIDMKMLTVQNTNDTQLSTSTTGLLGGSKTWSVIEMRSYKISRAPSMSQSSLSGLPGSSNTGFRSEASAFRMGVVSSVRDRSFIDEVARIENLRPTAVACSHSGSKTQSFVSDSGGAAERLGFIELSGDAAVVARPVLSSTTSFAIVVASFSRRCLASCSQCWSQSFSKFS
mmetsp:Transcript_93103/g.290238  ORF Transcript_93103/g.290238 Transcript_93103/m.290238 type:complete len:238 (+) Transcript_93103:1287-2000(+)